MSSPEYQKAWKSRRFKAGYCRSCGSNRPAQGKNYCRRCADTNRWGTILREFGLIKEMYMELFAKQGGVCAVCKKPETKATYGGVMWLSVDHDHRSDMVRGLLCNYCNRGIGLLQEDPAILLRAAEYVTGRALEALWK